MEIGGPADLSLLELIAIIGAATDTPVRAKHVPLPMMRAMSALLRPVNPALARQVQAGVVMDTTDMTFDATDFRRRYPSLPLTSITDVARREHVAEHLRPR